MQYNEQLAQYGILTKNTKAYEMRQDKIILSNIEIEEIDLKTLEEQKIKELVIKNSKINNLLFAQTNNIKLIFECCTFKNQIISQRLSFKKSIYFVFCVFQEEVGFLNTCFASSVSFNNSRFKGDAKFIKTTFCNDNYSNQDDFQQIANNFREAYFERQCYFDNITFKSSVSFSVARFQGDARFTNINFLSNQQNSKIIQNDFEEAYFNGNVLFASWNLCLKVNFILSRFNNEALFMDMLPDSFIFNNTNFNKAKFIYSNDYQNAIKQKYSDDNRYNSFVFQNSIFQDTLTFESTINIDIKFKFDNVVFKGIVTFNEANFSNKPSFTNCTFSNQFNIEHKHIQYSYEEIEKTQDYESLLNYRDLFRKLKSNRIAHHNLIDASELHSQELYARELELDSKETKTLKEKVEKWQLWFYRNLCDHHTDLLLNLKWLIIAIGLFTSLYFVSRLIQDISILESLNPFGICFSIACAFIARILYWFGHIERLDFFASLNAVITLWVICYKPQLIFGIANLLGNIKYNGFENFLITIYTIVIGLIIFSLQKTARKNSIVPN